MDSTSVICARDLDIALADLHQGQPCPTLRALVIFVTQLPVEIEINDAREPLIPFAARVGLGRIAGTTKLQIRSVVTTECRIISFNNGRIETKNQCCTRAYNASKLSRCIAHVYRSSARRRLASAIADGSHAVPSYKRFIGVRERVDILRFNEEAVHAVFHHLWQSTRSIRNDWVNRPPTPLKQREARSRT